MHWTIICLSAHPAIDLRDSITHPTRTHLNTTTGGRRDVVRFRFDLRETFGRILTDLAEKDKRIVAISAAMKEGTGLRGFSERVPDRFYDVGIAEPHAVTFAAGLATQGLRPVVAIFSTFLQRAYDEIVHDVCLQNLPVVFAIDRAGIVGEDGPTHNGLLDLSYLRRIPNIVVMAPKDSVELKNMFELALQHNGP